MSNFRFLLISIIAFSRALVFQFYFWVWVYLFSISIKRYPKNTFKQVVSIQKFTYRRSIVETSGISKTRERNIRGRKSLSWRKQLESVWHRSRATRNFSRELSSRFDRLAKLVRRPEGLCHSLELLSVSRGRASFVSVKSIARRAFKRGKSWKRVACTSSMHPMHRCTQTCLIPIARIRFRSNVFSFFSFLHACPSRMIVVHELYGRMLAIFDVWKTTVVYTHVLKSMYGWFVSYV